MLRLLDLRGFDGDPAPLLPRAPAADVAAARATVEALVADVADRGDAAVAEATLRFDGQATAPAAWRATQAELQAAEPALDAGVRAALLDAAARAREFHVAQRPPDVRWEGRPGVRLRLRHVPLARAGVYVPGGLGAYPSSVVMNVVPAQAAGVDEIVVATPPGPGGRGHPAILGAAALLGIEEVWLLGGAQAVAALALGTETIRRVDVLSGPGNLYVALAKQAVSGSVRVDGFAGPTEIAVIADGGADPAIVAADLVAQAEHDPLACCLLLTPDVTLPGRVATCLAEQVAATPHRSRVERALSGQSAAVLVDDIDAALSVAEAFAPEHLELLVDGAAGLADRVRNAGAVFVGPWTPVALGDYAAGTNHVLPTAGTARVSSGLSTSHFLRAMQVAEFDPDALAEAAPTVRALAAAEDLPAHAHAVTMRLQGRSRATPVTRRGGVPKVRPDLEGLAVYGAPQLDVPVRLNTNETPYPVPPAVMEEMAAAVRSLHLHRYPDREAVQLRRMLAAHAGHEVEGTWAANGSNEILQQLLLAFGGSGHRCLVVEPTYAMHGLIARATGTQLVTKTWPRAERPIGPADAAALVAEAGADLTLWCSPNNPTGEASPAAVLEAVCEAAPGLVVIDEAYGEFGTTSAFGLLGRLPNLVVARTFSKALRAAGVRLGYLLADPGVVEAIRLVRLPYHLSALTQAAAMCLLANAEALSAHVPALVAERERVTAALARLDRVRALPSEANFLCFSTPRRAREVWQGLLGHGVLVRDVSAYPTLDRFLRVTIGTPEENDAFLGAVGEVLASGPAA